MHIFYRCSFKSSNGYKTADYEYDAGSLIFIDESHMFRQGKISETILSTLNYALGRSMVLATDELGNYFFGVYNLIEGDYDKYVNAVFTDKNRGKICQLFFLFCSAYQDANRMLLNTVKRIPMDSKGLEFSVSKKDLEILMKASSHADSGIITVKRKKWLFAFITEENYSDYMEKLTDCCGLTIRNAVHIEHVRCNQTSIDVKSLIFKKWKKRFLLLCIVGVILSIYEKLTERKWLLLLCIVGVILFLITVGYIL